MKTGNTAQPPFRRSAALLLAGLVAACSNLPGPLAPRPAAPTEYWLKNIPAQERGQPIGRAESLLIYHDYLLRLSPAELARETEQMKHATATDKSDFTRLRHAMLLSMASGGPRDHGRAQQLLESIRDAKTTEPALRAFAALLLADLAERRRLEESLQTATQRTKDEQARAADLQQKLDALKAIEKSIAERKTAPAAPTPGARPSAPRQ